MKQHACLCAVIVLLAGLFTPSIPGQDKLAPQAAKDHSFIYRTFNLSSKEPEISQKMNEFDSEGWILSSSYTDSSGKLVGIFKRPYTTLDLQNQPLLKGLQGKWCLESLREYQNEQYKNKSDKDRKEKPPTLTFKGNSFTFAEGTSSKTGTIQFIRKTGWSLIVDLLIEKENGKDSFFTVRTRINLKGSADLSCSSSGRGSDRPPTDEYDPKVVAYSTYKKCDSAK